MIGFRPSETQQEYYARLVTTLPWRGHLKLKLLLLIYLRLRRAKTRLGKTISKAFVHLSRT